MISFNPLNFMRWTDIILTLQRGKLRLRETMCLGNWNTWDWNLGWLPWVPILNHYAMLHPRLFLLCPFIFIHSFHYILNFFIVFLSLVYRKLSKDKNVPTGDDARSQRRISLSRAFPVVVIELFLCYPYNCHFVDKATGAPLEMDSEMKILVEGIFP